MPPPPPAQPGRRRGKASSWSRRRASPETLRALARRCGGPSEDGGPPAGCVGNRASIWAQTNRVHPPARQRSRFQDPGLGCGTFSLPTQGPGQRLTSQPGVLREFVPQIQGSDSLDTPQSQVHF